MWHPFAQKRAVEEAGNAPCPVLRPHGAAVRRPEGFSHEALGNRAATKVTGIMKLGFHSELREFKPSVIFFV